jgi:hypothetical protein
MIALDRDSAYALVLEKIGRNNLLKHIIAVEAGMRRLARELGEDEEVWGLVGLVHDLDYMETKDDESRHALLACEWLAPYQFSDEMLYAIKAHPGHVPCRSAMDWALYATDPATGFIVACALMHPQKKLAAIDSDFMMRRLAQKRFAAGASRENIAACTHLGFEQDQFLTLIREAMMDIHDELGL